MGYIYKITNTQTKKVYIGKTICENPENRWTQHKQTFREEKGGCPALRDAVRRYGIDAFRFEVLIICFDEACDQIEREYIAKYNCIVPNGYNILEGGQCGGGFKGKKHSAETVERLRITSKQAWKNPEYAKKASERTKKQMAAIDKETHRNRTLNSEKFQKAVKEGRVGAGSHKTGDGTLSAETKERIRKGVQKYYENCSAEDRQRVDIEKHRLVMAKARGRKVDQFDSNNTFIATHISISEASRTTGIKKAGISSVLRGRNKTAKGFIWRYHDEGVQNERPANVIVTPDA
jgi:group I intron endonuclease